MYAGKQALSLSCSSLCAVFFARVVHVCFRVVLVLGLLTRPRLLVGGRCKGYKTLVKSEWAAFVRVWRVGTPINSGTAFASNHKC